MSLPVIQRFAISPAGPSFFKSVFGIFLDRKSGVEVMDYITSCVSALLFYAACCWNPTTHGKESETASGGTHICDIFSPSDWAMLPEEEMTALCHTPPTS